MIGGDKETKAKILKLIGEWTPLAAWGVKLSLSYTRGGFLVIKHKGEITEHYKGFIEGMLAGAQLCPKYYPDGGPCNCWEPSIEWRRTDVGDEYRNMAERMAARKAK